MITEKQTIRKVREMLTDVDETLRIEVRRLFKSGGIDPEKFKNNFELPKKLLHVALLNVADNYLPPSGPDNDIQNLKHF